MRRRPDPILGVVAGVAMAVLLSAWALAVYLFRGPGAFQGLGTSFTVVVAVNFAAGILGGVIVGLLLPLTVWRWGAVVVGILAAIPFYLAITLASGDNDILFVVIGSVGVGGIVGYGAWSPPKHD